MKQLTLPLSIAIEGIDGAGKATQAKMLQDALIARGIKSTIFAFPRYDTPTGKIVKAYLDGQFGDPVEVHPALASNLYSIDRVAARSEIFTAGIDGVVIFDRFTGSNLAHQGAKLNHAELEGFFTVNDYIEHELFSLPKPAVTVFLDLDSSISVANTVSRAEADASRSTDGHETNAPYLARVRDTYRHLAVTRGWKIVTADAGGEMRSQESIHQDVLSEFLKAAR